MHPLVKQMPQATSSMYMDMSICCQPKLTNLQSTFYCHSKSNFLWQALQGRPKLSWYKTQTKTTCLVHWRLCFLTSQKNFSFSLRLMCKMYLSDKARVHCMCKGLWPMSMGWNQTTVFPQIVLVGAINLVPWNGATTIQGQALLEGSYNLFGTLPVKTGR